MSIFSKCIYRMCLIFPIFMVSCHTTPYIILDLFKEVTNEIVEEIVESLEQNNT